MSSGDCIATVLMDTLSLSAGWEQDKIEMVIRNNDKRLILFMLIFYALINDMIAIKTK